jgi:pectinesterase
VVALDSVTGKELPTQLIDEDQDGVPDLFLVLVDLPAGGAAVVGVMASSAGKTPFPPLTDARFVLPREDLAWENDHIAFRMYGPALAKEVSNGIDVWCKRVRYPVVQKWYKAAETAPPGHDPYHEDHGEGADFFAVGRTLGAGGCALIEADTLKQPGVFDHYRVISSGPLRALFELSYQPVQIGRRKIAQTLRIALDAGKNLNRVDVLFRADGESATLPFAVGIVTRKGVKAYADTALGIAAFWGLTTDRTEDGSLGTGIVMDPSQRPAIREDPMHLLCVGKAPPGVAVRYYAGAGWTTSGDFASEREWQNYLREFALNLRSPLIVTITPAP